jgi:hypothetical protein
MWVSLGLKLLGQVSGQGCHRRVFQHLSAAHLGSEDFFNATGHFQDGDRIGAIILEVLVWFDRIVREAQLFSQDGGHHMDELLLCRQRLERFGRRALPPPAALTLRQRGRVRAPQGLLLTLTALS